MGQRLWRWRGKRVRADGEKVLNCRIKLYGLIVRSDEISRLSIKSKAIAHFMKR